MTIRLFTSKINGFYGTFTVATCLGTNNARLIGEHLTLEVAVVGISGWLALPGCIGTILDDVLGLTQGLFM